MSITIMSQVWPLQMPQSPKVVLLALADAANDDGITWIAVETAKPGKLDLQKKCCLKERGLQNALKWLIAAGHLSREDRPGRGVIWTVHPAKTLFDTPAPNAPPHQMHPAPNAGTPAPNAPKPSLNLLPLSSNKLEDAPQAVFDEVLRDWDQGAKPDHAKPDHVKADQGAPRGDGNTPEKLKRFVLPSDWQAPPIDALQPEAQALVRQWPRGAYASICASFRNHWRDVDPKKRTARGHHASLCNWVVRDHPSVMRSAKAGISFEACEPAGSGTAAIFVKPLPVAEQVNECPRSAAIRKAIKDDIGDRSYYHWFGPLALNIRRDGSLCVIAPSEFGSSWVRQNYASLIEAIARRVIGAAFNGIQFLVTKGDEHGEGNQHQKAKGHERHHPAQDTRAGPRADAPNAAARDC